MDYYDFPAADGTDDLEPDYGIPESPLKKSVKLLANAARDPALREAIKSMMMEQGLWEALGMPMPLKRIEGPPPALPPLSAITLIQTAIFDNWPKGRAVEGHPNRYGCALEIWTLPKESIEIKRRPNCQHKTQMSLMDAKAFKAMIRTLRKPRVAPVDSGYLESMDGLLEFIAADDWLIGLANTRIADDKSAYGRGTWYHTAQFILIKIKDRAVTDAILVLGDEKLELARFDEQDAAGRAHGGRVILQSRHDLCGLSEKSWATNDDENDTK